MNRQRQRAFDVSESYFLLLELCCCEPIIQQCFSIIENVCLAQGVSVAGATSEFRKFLDLHYVPFLRSAIRAMHMYGFVPWRVVPLPTGDRVPEVLPPGTFRWTVEPPPEGDHRMLRYVVRMNSGAKSVEPEITVWTPPHNVCENSVMYATVPSPMAYIIESYKNLQSASKRQASADAWNCTARVIVSNEPKEFAHDQHRKELFGTFHQHIDEYGRLHPIKPTNPADKLDDMFYTRSMNHTPSVYTLPAHHHLDTAPVLQPCADLPFLQTKYKCDVCALVGVPPTMIATASSDKKEDNMVQSAFHSRIFQSKMQTICAFLKALLAEVYTKVYKGQTATFELTPMPRLEISKVEDLKILHEAGILQPDHTVELASVLLGKIKRAKLDTSIKTHHDRGHDSPQNTRASGTS